MFRTVVLLCLAATSAPAQDVEKDDPKIAMFLQYAGIVGKITACGPLDHTDMTVEMAAALTEEDAPGFWAWISGGQSDYYDSLIRRAEHEKTMADLSGCQIAPLQGHYRSLLRSIEGTLLN
jgi:hypothetical protein